MHPETMPLIRKRYLVSPQNITTLERLAKDRGMPATAIVREAIEAYDPESLNGLGEQALVQLVSTWVKVTIQDTRATRENWTKPSKPWGIHNGRLERRVITRYLETHGGSEAAQSGYRTI